MSDERNNSVSKIDSAPPSRVSQSPATAAKPTPVASSPPAASPVRSQPAAGGESTSLSREGKGLAADGQKSKSGGGVMDAFANAGTKAFKDLYGGIGQGVHNLKENVDKKASKADANREGVNPEDLKKLDKAAQIEKRAKEEGKKLGFRDIATLSVARKLTGSEDLGKAAAEAHKWNDYPQGIRDTIADGLQGASGVLGAIDNVIHPHEK